MTDKRITGKAIALSLAILVSSSASAAEPTVTPLTEQGLPSVTFEGSAPGPVLNLNDQGMPAFPSVPDRRRDEVVERPAPASVAPAVTLPSAAPIVTPQRLAPLVTPQPPAPVVAPQTPAPVVMPQPAAPVVMPQPAAPVVIPQPAAPVVIPQPAVPAAAVLPPSGIAPVMEAPAVVTPVSPPGIVWETPPQGKPPFEDTEPAPAVPSATLFEVAPAR